MDRYTLISAIGTPLTDDEGLHVEGLEAQIDDQWNGGMTGLLVAGTMGAMQLLADQTYEDLVDHSIRANRGRGEVLVGVGDASFARTLQRIRLLNGKKADGVVILSPYFMKFSPGELVDYFTALADESTHPVYLYDLPVLTGVKLDLETVRTLSRHKNIRGIKCSCEFGWTRQLIDEGLDNFRIIVAQPDLIDVLMRSGVMAHLDGIFAVAPHWISEIANAASREDWATAAEYQRKICTLLQLLRSHSVLPTFTVMMNARGIPGRYAPRPLKSISPRVAETVLDAPIMKELLKGGPSKASRRNPVAAAEAR